MFGLKNYSIFNLRVLFIILTILSTDFGHFVQTIDNKSKPRCHLCSKRPHFSLYHGAVGFGRVHLGRAPFGRVLLRSRLVKYVSFTRHAIRSRLIITLPKCVLGRAYYVRSHPI